MKTFWFLLLTISLSWTGVQLHGEQRVNENFYTRWLFNGGFQLIAEKEVQEAKQEQALREYMELENLKRMYELTIEINQIDVELNQKISAKGELFNQKLSDARINIAIAKLADKLKGKVNILAKLSK